MPIRVHRYENAIDVEHFLNGGITGGREIVSSAPVLGLHGKTLVFNAPAGTVTFSDPAGVGLSAAQIKSKIEGTIATLKVTWVHRRIRIILAAMTSKVDLDATGTANEIFGFSSTSDTAGTVYAGPSGSAPKIIATEANPNADGWAIFVELP